MTTQPELATHEENLAYYRRSETGELLRFLPQARYDHDDTGRRLAAILAVLGERGVSVDPPRP